MEKLRLRQQIEIRFPQAPPPGKVVTARVPIKDHQVIINNRGQILSTAIMLEQELEQILEILLHSDLYNSSDFGKKIWRKRNIDFNVKFEMLRAVSPSHKYIKSDQDEWKKFRQVLHKVIEIRNRFAHGKIYFKEDKAYLLFVEANKEKTVELNDTYWKTVKEKFDRATMLSTELTSKLLEYSNATSHNSS